MARIAGVNLPLNKRAEVGLTYVFGIGRSTANEILKQTGVDPNTAVKDLTEDEIDAFQPVRQRLIRTHPVTQRRSLFLSSHAGAIEGWTVPEARMFLRDLTEHATQREFVYSHEWRPFDLVMWDNRTTMHRARRFDRNEIRDVRRTTLAGDVITIEQHAAAE